MNVKEIKEQLKDMFRTVLNEKWITIHPHGEDSEDYRRIKLEDGETPKEAIDRIYKKNDNKEVKKDDKKEPKEDTKVDLSKYSTEELEQAQQTYKSNLGSASEYGDDQYNAEKQMLDDITKELETRKSTDKKDEPKEPKEENDDVEIEKTTRKSAFGDKDIEVTKLSKGDKRVEIDKYGEKDYHLRGYQNGHLYMTHDLTSEKGAIRKAKEYLGVIQPIERKPREKKPEAPLVKTDLNAAEAKYKEVLKRYNENNSKRWQSGISDAEYYKASAEAEKAKKELTVARREYAESIMANFEEVENNPYEQRIEDKKMRYAEMARKTEAESNRMAKISSDMISAIPMGQPILVGHHSEAADRRYRQRAWDKMDKSYQLGKKADYYAGKAASVGTAGISADDANAIAKLAKKYKSGVTSAEKRRIIDRVIDIHKNRQMAGDTSRPTDYSDLGFQVERNAEINRLQLKFDGKPDENTRSILKSNGFRWSPREGAWQRQLGGNSEYGLNRVIEKLKGVNNSLLEGLDDILSNSEITENDYPLYECINNLLDPTVNNDKEQEMALIEELKKLITKVENGKESDMEKIENEKVDKRKLIDEVGGILKGKVDDEIIRTIIGKLEKVAYDKSEAGTADNEKDEKDEKEVECCKAKNEDDEKEVEEVKEDVKEDVENKKKVENGKDHFDSLNEIYNATSQAKTQPVYMSREERENAAVEYFS